MLSSNLKIPKTARQPLKTPTDLSIILPCTHRVFSDVFRMFGRTIRLEPATGSRRLAPDDGDRPARSDRQAREFSTLKPTLPGFMAVRRPVQLTQFNPMVGRRMFGLAASLVLRRRLI